MAADDEDDRGQAPDPWDEIVADGLGEGGGEISFNFDDAADGSAGESPASVPAPGDAAGAGEPAGVTEDALIENWLAAGDSDPAVPTGGGPDDQAAGSSEIEIGTGGSGVALHGRPEQEEIGDAASGGDPSSEPSDIGWPGTETPDGEAAEESGFPGVSTAATETTAGAAAGGGGRKPVRPVTKRKSGGLGQIVGVVLGGAMAVPITLAILIYVLGRDPFGVTKQVPEQVAFLLPEKFRPGYKKPAAPKADADEAEPSALDALPTVAEPEEPAGEPAPEEPNVGADADVPEMPADPEPDADVAAIDTPSLDDLGAKPAAAAAEPPPLDTSALDAAVGDAAALCEALGVVDDRGSRAYTKLRTRWYRALARVAEELVAVEHAAATSGRPLDEAPDNVSALHGTIGGRELLRAELAALAPDWLAYAKRGSDGVILPVTFESARRVGPFWATRVSFPDAEGASRDFTVISRSEPAAVAGDAVVVTGVMLDGAVIWAADVRGSGGGLSAGF